MIPVDCTIGPLSFLHVNVSGGELTEVQDNVRVVPRTAIILDVDDGECILGATGQTNTQNKEKQFD